MDHVRGVPHRSQTQSKIERRRQTIRNRILLENDFPPGDLEASMERFVEHHNHHRHHESLGDLTSADFCAGCGKTILPERELIEQKTTEQRLLQHRRRAA